MSKLRWYQEESKQNILEALETYRAVLAVAPCRSGKTVTFCNILEEMMCRSVIMQHRQELIYQSALTLTRNQVKFDLVANATLRKRIVRDSISLYGKNYYTPGSMINIASVGQLINMPHSWLAQIRLIVADECHHMTQGSSWEKAFNLMPNAKLIGFTATPCRLDGKGLGKASHGLFETMVQSPTARQLINEGYISDYKIFVPGQVSGLDMVKITSGGEFDHDQLKAVMDKSQIVGNLAHSYNTFVPGKKGLIFTIDIESAERMAETFNSMGIKSAAVSGKTDPDVRAKALVRLERGDLKCVFNCELFGEGTDLPAIDFVMFARPTMSFGLYYQQFFRPLSLDPNNPAKVGYVIDHVGNVYRHGLPDADRVWELNPVKRSSKTKKPSGVVVCDECLGVYERVVHGRTCPYCQFHKPVTPRTPVEEVAGDLQELSPETLEKMRLASDQNRRMPHMPHNATPIVRNSIMKNHKLKLEALDNLCYSIATWASDKHDIPMAQRLFWETFGIDVLTAQTLNKSEADNLRERVENER